MKTTNGILSDTRLNRLHAQGYQDVDDQYLSDLAFGIRFPYRVCVLIVLAGMWTQSVEIFGAMAVIAVLGVILPNHPFDHIYNYVLSPIMKLPKVPVRSKQLKFACTIATLWLCAVIALLVAGLVTAALVVAGALAFVALLPATIDFCVPSVIYNNLFRTSGCNIEAP